VVIQVKELRGYWELIPIRVKYVVVLQRKAGTVWMDWISTHFLRLISTFLLSLSGGGSFL